MHSHYARGRGGYRGRFVGPPASAARGGWQSVTRPEPMQTDRPMFADSVGRPRDGPTAPGIPAPPRAMDSDMRAWVELTSKLLDRFGMRTG
jgi:hypothetical protein